LKINEQRVALAQSIEKVRIVRRTTAYLVGTETISLLFQIV